MKSVKGTKTELNLLKAFAGESQARNRYTYFASQAKEEGFIQISEIFSETANQESQHAKRFFSFLEGGEVEISASFPAGKIQTTAENLAAAAAGENHEWTSLYQSFAETATQEGFAEIAVLFKAISVAEKQHEKRFNKLLENIQKKQVFAKSQKTVWACLNCGYIYEGEAAPNKCPACAYPQSYFELIRENW